MSPENLSLVFPTRSDTNWAVQPQKMARGLKFRIQKFEGLYHLCRKKKALISCVVTAQLICVFVFAYAKSRLSHDTTNFEVCILSNPILQMMNMIQVFKSPFVKLWYGKCSDNFNTENDGTSLIFIIH